MEKTMVLWKILHNGTACTVKYEKKTIALWKKPLTIIWKNYGTISKAMVL